MAARIAVSAANTRRTQVGLQGKSLLNVSNHVHIVHFVIFTTLHAHI
jgi:hypothetical protein